MRDAGLRQKDLADRIGLPADALSRALNGERGFAAVELAQIARELGADVHYFITGEPSPTAMRISARHEYDPATRTRGVSGIEADRLILSDVALAYEQAGDITPSTRLPSTPAEMGEALGEDFAGEFADRLGGLEVDVICINDLSTAYSFTISGRHIIVVPTSGNWFRTNWSIAHELGHLCAGHEEVHPGNGDASAPEREADRFAAELLLPKHLLTDYDWERADLRHVAQLVWSWGVSTQALKIRLSALGLASHEQLTSELEGTTQRFLRHHLPPMSGDPISERMTASTARRFPDWLKEAHLNRIAEGVVRKHTLAWMLNVDPGDIEVEEPDPPHSLGADALRDLLV